jgi:hypothetical protein
MPGTDRARRADAMSKRVTSSGRTNPSSRVALLVMERGEGAARLADALAQCSGALDTVVVAQQVDETPADLALRVIRRLLKLEREGCALVSSTLLTNRDCGSEWQSARAAITGMARQLIARRGMLASGRPGEQAPGRPSSPRPRAGLMGAQAAIRVDSPGREARNAGAAEAYSVQPLRGAWA